MSINSHFFPNIRILRLLILLIGGSFMAVPLKASLVAYWDFDSKSGCTVSDVTGNGHTGTFVGCADITTGCGGFNGVGEALCLSNDCGCFVRVACPTTGICVDTDHTWYAWIQTTCCDGAIFARNEACGWSRGSRSLFVRCCDLGYDSAWVGFSDTCTNVTDGNWKQVVMTYTESTDTLRFYIDGVHLSCQDDSSRNWDNYNENYCSCGYQAEQGFTIGQNDQPCPDHPSFADQCTLQGKIDDAGVYNEVLTGCEIKVSYDISTDCNLKYDLGSFDLMKQQHDTGSGSVCIDGQVWTYETGLTCAEGLHTSCASYTVVMDDAANTGLTTTLRFYWDVDNCNTGATSCGSGNATGDWTTSSCTWSLNCAGSGSNVKWVCGGDVVFSAGCDATGTYTVRAQTCCMQVGAIYFTEGEVTLSASTGSRKLIMSDCTPIVCVSAPLAIINLQIHGCNGFIKNGAGTLRMGSGQGSKYTGDTIINAGTILLGANNTLPTGTSMTIACGATLDVACRNQTIAGLSGCGSVELGTGTFTVGNSNATSTFAGTFKESGSFVKTGSGTLTLTGNSTADGTFTINAGTLSLGVDNALDDAADIDLNGGTLGLAANVQDTIADLSVSSNSSMTFDTQADLTTTNFTMTAGRTLAITGWNNSVRYSTSQGDGTSFRVDNYPSGIDLNNVTVNGVTAQGVFMFVYNSGDGHFYLTHVTPEPSTYMAGGALVFLLIGHCYLRRRRKAKDRS